MPALAQSLITLGRSLTGTLDSFMPGMRELDASGGEDWSPDDLDAYCPRCGASAATGDVTPAGCAECRNHRLPWERVIRLGPYQPPLADWLRAFKFHQHWAWGPWLGGQLASVMEQPLDPARIAVCPVPMHWLRRCQRGYNQAHLIARQLARATGWPEAPVLKRIRHTLPQTAVSPGRRAANVRDTFACDRVDLTGWQIVLIDDIKTTGATLGTCARLLRQQGARCVDVAVAAVADPKG
jgi:ComF family protein